jgi:hypothetical protein
MNLFYFYYSAGKLMKELKENFSRLLPVLGFFLEAL